MTERIVVADIGGTHARFALADRALTIGVRRVFASREFTSQQALIDAYLATLDARPGGIAIAVAGPVADGRANLTNAAIRFDTRSLARRYGEALIVNDFVAASLGVLHARPAELHRIGAGEPRAATKAVIGPGTGLGMGILVPEGGAFRALSSEGGHGDLASTDPLEHEIYQQLASVHGFVCWETVLSGPGIVNLYRAVCAVWGTQAVHDDPAAITAHATDAREPVCHQTVELFCNLLGTAAGNLALTVCAEGGVYLCGGIVPAILAQLSASHFRRRFETRGPLSDYARRIATTAVTSDALGLVGAAAAFWRERDQRPL